MKKIENLGLKVVLGALCLLAVGLGVVVVVNLNMPQAVDEEQEDGDSKDDNGLAAYNDYQKDLDDAQKKAKGMIEKPPVDKNAIIELFSNYINKYTEKGEIGRASTFIKGENSTLIAAGFREEALDVLLEIDFSLYDGPDQYRWYEAIIAQAEALGKDNIVTEYKQKLEGVRAAYEASYRASEAAAARGEAEINNRKSSE